jgi:hypothetical protein
MNRKEVFRTREVQECVCEKGKTGDESGEGARNPDVKHDLSRWNDGFGPDDGAKSSKIQEERKGRKRDEIGKSDLHTVILCRKEVAEFVNSQHKKNCECVIKPEFKIGEFKWITPCPLNASE